MPLLAGSTQLSQAASQRAVRQQFVRLLQAMLFLILAAGLDDGLPRFVRQCRAVSGRQAAFHPAVALMGGKQKAVHHRAISRYLDVAAGASPHSSLLAGHQGLGRGAGPTKACGGRGVCGWLDGRRPSSFWRTQAPGQGPRLFMRHRHVFSCAFPHVPVHCPRPCAAKVTLPDSSKVHPPNVLLPVSLQPRPFSPATKNWRAQGAHAPERKG